MHGFYAMGAVLHTIVVAVVAFFVLFTASKAVGFTRLLGHVLGWILLVGAAASLAIGIYFAATGHRPAWMERDHQGWMAREKDGDGAAPSPGAPPPPSH